MFRVNLSEAYMYVLTFWDLPTFGQLKHDILMFNPCDSCHAIFYYYKCFILGLEMDVSKQSYIFIEQFVYIILVICGQTHTFKYIIA